MEGLYIVHSHMFITDSYSLGPTWSCTRVNALSLLLLFYQISGLSMHYKWKQVHIGIKDEVVQTLASLSTILCRKGVYI